MFLYCLGILFYSSDLWARSIVGIADKFGTEASRVGVSVGLVGLIFGGVALAIGRQDAGMKITMAILGLIILLTKDSILSFLRGLV